MRKTILKIAAPVLRRFTKYYFSKPRPYKYKGIKGVILPGVFYPFFTISTKLLLNFLEPQNLKNKHFLELGCGTGFISVLAAKKGAKTTASDINPSAIENVKRNAKSNGVEVLTILSDLFKKIPEQVFDYIIINPPYYQKVAQSVEEKAWFCGANFEYFKELFSSINDFFNEQSMVYMILSEDCKIESIQNIAKQHDLVFDLIKTQKKYGELNYIFQLLKQ